MTTIESPVEPEHHQQTVKSKCRCGYGIAGRASSVPRYCGGCGVLLDATAAERRKKLRVLVVDDSKTVRTGVARMLAKMDCEVTEARDGQEALDLIKARPPHLVVSDIMMPRMNGVELLSVLRASPRYSEIPVAVLTSADDAEVLRQAMGLDVLAYVLKKQVDQDELKRRLRQCVDATHKLMSRQHEKKILLVEDSMLRKALAQMLKQMGCEVLEAANGEEALSILQGNCPDLVITDLEMPRMNGLELVKALRRDDRLKDVPAVMLTSVNDAETMSQAISAGLMAYLIKDQLTPQDLKRQLEQCVVVATTSTSASCQS